MSSPDEIPLDAYKVPALERGLSLLGLFSPSERRLTGAQMSKRLGFPRASVFRLLYTLEQMGFVERIAGTAEYSLGVAVLRLGFEYLASQDLTELGRPAVDALRDSTGMTALFQSIPVGARLPVHATALGRCLLADLTEAQLHSLYSGQVLSQHTMQTPITVEQLFIRVTKDRDQGYSISEAGFEPGISTIAAPVRNAHQHIVASLSITVPASQILDKNKSILMTQVCDAAAALSQRLRHAGHDK
jgi:DNA-binding IclR family transcriptional regulator